MKQKCPIDSHTETILKIVSIVSSGKITNEGKSALLTHTEIILEGKSALFTHTDIILKIASHYQRCKGA